MTVELHHVRHRVQVLPGGSLVVYPAAERPDRVELMTHCRKRFIPCGWFPCRPVDIEVHSPAIVDCDTCYP